MRQRARQRTDRRVPCDERPSRNAIQKARTNAIALAAVGLSGICSLAESALLTRSAHWRAAKAAYFATYLVYRVVRDDSRRIFRPGAASARTPVPTVPELLEKIRPDGDDDSSCGERTPKRDFPCGGSRATWTNRVNGPAVGAALAGAAVLGAASLLGLAEAAMGAAAAYGTYRVLSRRGRREVDLGKSEANR
jgi:hypothetical protein